MVDNTRLNDAKVVVAKVEASKFAARSLVLEAEVLKLEVTSGTAFIPAIVFNKEVVKIKASFLIFGTTDD